jgi:hypothetical protein
MQGDERQEKSERLDGVTGLLGRFKKQCALCGKQPAIGHPVDFVSNVGMLFGAAEA